MREPEFVVWVSGPARPDVEAVIDALGSRLAARHAALETLDERTPGIAVLAGDEIAARVTFIAEILVRHGVGVLVGVPATREAREQARAHVGRLIEVWVHAEEAAAPPDYQPPERPEVEIITPDPAGA